MKLWITVIAFVVSFLGCEHYVPTPAEDPSTAVEDSDISRKSKYDRACDHLIDLGCPEGTPQPGAQTCAETLKEAIGYHITAITTECIMDAKTKTAVHVCNVRCGKK